MSNDLNRQGWRNAMFAAVGVGVFAVFVALFGPSKARNEKLIGAAACGGMAIYFWRMLRKT